MKPIRVVMSAFGSYGGVEEVRFEAFDHGIFLITGDTGAGKTTIFDAITYALYDQTSGGKRDGEMMRSDFASEDTPTFVELTFRYHGNVYTVKRNPKYTRMSKRKNKAGDLVPVTENPSVELTMPDGRIFDGKVKETNKKIVEIMGIDVNQFTQIAMIAQGDFLKLLHAPTKERKEIFSRIFDTKIYARIQEELRNRGRMLESELAKNRTQCVQEIERVTLKQDSAYESLWQDKKVFSEIDSSQLLELVRQIIEEIESEEEQLTLQTTNMQVELDRIKSEYQLGESLNKLIAKHESAQQEYKVLQEKEADYNAMKDETEAGKKALPVHQKDIEFKKKQKELHGTTLRLEAIKNELLQLEETMVNAEVLKDNAVIILKEANQSIHPELIRIKDSLHAYDVFTSKSKELENLNKSQGILVKKQEQNQLELIENQKLNKTLTQEQETLKNADADCVRADQTVTLLQDKVKRIRLMLESSHKFSLLEIECTKQRRIVKEKQETYRSLSDRYEQIYSDFISEQVGIIASTLVDGKACPVCGSLEHPRKATLASKDVSQKQVDEAKKDRNLSEQALQTSVEVMNGCLIQLEKEQSSLDREGKMLFGDSFCMMESEIRRIQQESEQSTISLEEALLRQKTAYEHKTVFDSNHLRLEAIAKKLDSLLAEKEVIETEKNKLILQAGTLQTEIRNIQESLSYTTKVEALGRIDLLEKQLNKLEEEAQKYEKRYQELINAKEKNQGRLKAEEIALLRQKEESESLQYEYVQLIIAQGFVDENSYKNSYREETWILEQEQSLRLYRENTIRALEAVKTYGEQRDGKSMVDLLQLSEHIELLTTNYNKLIEQGKQLYTLKESDKRSEAYLTSLFAKRSGLKKEYEVLNTLDRTANGNLTGMAKMDFQTYIQRRYFEHIIREANKRLQVMSSEQFILRCRDLEDLGSQGEVGLDLDVYSLVKDRIRDVKTLSGGESFMSSLAMALGMADVIQNTAGKIHLDTMFIDEGFGSLDDETRDQAIKILNSLAEGKRLVGIISHVSELKDRINQKLCVTKDEKGSRIHWEQQ